MSLHAIGADNYEGFDASHLAAVVGASFSDVLSKASSVLSTSTTAAQDLSKTFKAPDKPKDEKKDAGASSKGFVDQGDNPPGSNTWTQKQWDDYDDARAAAKGGKSAGKAPKEEGGESWITKPVLGPIPGWGVLTGGAGILGGIALVLAKVLKR